MWAFSTAFLQVSVVTFELPSEHNSLEDMKPFDDILAEFASLRRVVLDLLSEKGRRAPMTDETKAKAIGLAGAFKSSLPSTIWRGCDVQVKVDGDTDFGNTEYL